MAKAPDTILKLVENFEQNIDSFKTTYKVQQSLKKEEFSIIENQSK